VEEQPGNNVGGAVPVEPPHSIAQARVDEKGRLKFPAEFLEYLKKMGVDKVFITTMDRELARIYPISVWKANESFFANAGDLAELAEDVAYVAKYFGGDSEIDAQGRVLLPAALRRELELESQTVFLDCYNGRINVAGKEIHDERINRAMANVGDKLKTLEKRGLK
jgi:DNA-binding transcriptional regulator/RsmH inhibitor MraZ